MTTTYTPEQIAEAVKEAYGVQLAEADTAARTLATSLGLTVEDPKPLESGVYRHEDGRMVHLRDYSTLAIMDAHVNSPWAKENRDKLTPARVVPDEAIEDARSEATDIIQEEIQGYIRTRLNIADTGGDNAHSGTIEQIRHLHLAEPWLPAVEAVNKLAEAGLLTRHDATAPDWDDVRNAVAENRGNGWGLNDDAINAITDSVIALLEGGKA